MCTLVVLRRPDHPWPLLLAANRDEMDNRPWLPPGRHWPDRDDVVAGRDELAGGTWLGLNDDGVVAAILNRINTLGPALGIRSRGELPLEALDNGDAQSAADALTHLDPAAYRPFNMIVADNAQGFWIRAVHGGNGGAGRIDVFELPPGLSMLTAYDLNDTRSPRMRHYLPRFAEAAVPVPERGDWKEWMTLLADEGHEPTAGPGGAMRITTDTGFGTVSSALIALPAGGRDRAPIWLFAPGPPGVAPYVPVRLDQ
ncbi:MAG: NRDE family protein [Hyphomicrobium sp.]